MFQSRCRLSRSLTLSSVIGVMFLSGVVQAETPEFVPQEGRDRGQRVDIAEGDVNTKELFRFLADYTGLAVLVDDGSTAQIEKPITVVAPIIGADEKTVMALLEANRWSGTRTLLTNGREVIKMSYAGRGRTTGTTRSRGRTTFTRPRATAGARARTATSRTRGTTSRTRSPAERADTSRKAPDTSGGPIFAFGPKGLVALETKTDSLFEHGLSPDSRTTVVAHLTYIEPKAAVATLYAIRPPNKGDAEFVVAEVKGARKVVVAGSAFLVDYALRVLKALDVSEEQSSLEPIVEIFQIEHIDVQEAAATITRFLASSSQDRRAPVHVEADARSQKLIVEAFHPKDLERVRMLISELDVKSEGRRLRTHIRSLKFVEAMDMAKTLIKLLGRGDPAGSLLIVPHKPSNSLLIQATPEASDEIERLLKQIDVSAIGQAPAGGAEFE